MLRVGLFLLCALLVAGCPSPPPPRPKPEPEPEEPERPPWELPIRGGIEVTIDAEGEVRIEGKRVENLRMVLLDMTSSERRQDAAVRVEVASQAPWLAAQRLMTACAGAGLRNLHWQIKGDPRAPAYWPLPKKRAPAGMRKSVVRVTWDGTEALYSWRGIPGDDPEPHLSRERLVGKVRAHHSRRAILVFPLGLPFEVAFELGLALRGTGVRLEFAEGTR